jgi:hypothetical protein
VSIFLHEVFKLPVSTLNDDQIKNNKRIKLAKGSKIRPIPRFSLGNDSSIIRNWNTETMGPRKIYLSVAENVL